MKFFKFLISVVISFFTPFQLLSQITFKPNITHVSCVGSTNGSISLSNVSGGVAPYTYTWQPGSITTSSISSKGYGNYTVTVKGTGTITTTKALSIGYKVRWQNMYSTMSQSNDTLKHGTGGSSWLFSAKSSNMLANSTNGWVEYVVQSMDHRIFGLADSGSVVGWNTIDYAMILNSGGTYNTCNNGSQTSIGSYTVGDVMRVERNGANITYSKNGTSVWTTTITSTMQQSKMFIGSAVYTTGSNIANVGCSFQSVNAVAGPSMTISCSNPTVNINVYTNVASPNYSWTPGGSTPTASSTAVSSSGTYSVKVTEPYYGCNVTQTISVTSNTTIPTLTITNSPTITCSSPTVVLTSTTSTGGVTYSWSPGGATTSTLSVTTAGTYTLKATNPTNGCSITKTVSVASNTTIPTLTITNSPTITCSSPTVVLTSTTTTGGVTYSWSPGGATTSTLSVTTTGTYTLKATNPTNGCSITKTVSVVSNTVLPNVNAGLNKIITASVPSATLSGSSSTSGVTYSWSPGGTSPTNSITVVSSSGIYSLSVTNPLNGCSATDTVLITTKFSSIANIQDYTNDSIKGEVTLSIVGGTPPYNIVWNGNKIPDSNVAYQMLIDSLAGISVDSVYFKHQIDSLRQRLVYSELLPGTYPVTVYDNVNDSINLMVYVGESIESLFGFEASSSSCSIENKTFSNVEYNYGSGKCISQSGAFTAGQHYAIPHNVIEFSDNNEIRFSIPDNRSSCSVGLHELKSEVNGGTDDIESKASIKFYGDETFRIFLDNNAIYSDNFSSGDYFSIKINSSPEKISFYKNETLLIEDFYSSINTAEYNLVKVVLGSSGATVNGLKIIKNGIYQNKNIGSISGTITDVTCGASCIGSILAKGQIFLGEPNKYEIYNLGSTNLISTINVSSINSALFTDLCPRVYTVKYYAYVTPLHNIGSTAASILTTTTQTFEVAYMPDWINYNSTAVSINSMDRSLTKTSSPFAWDAGASSLNRLLASEQGWIEWKSPSNYAVNGTGFSISDINTDIATVNYGIGNAKIPITIFGVTFDFSFYILTQNQTMVSAISASKPSGNFVLNDVFRIEKKIIAGASSLIFKKNNLQIGLPISISSSNELIFDVALKLSNGIISHPRASFGCPSIEQYTMLHKKLDGGYHLLYDQKLMFKYDEEYKDVDGILNFNIYNSQNIVVCKTSSMITPPSVVYGDNRYSIDLSNTSNYVSGQTMPNNNFYVLEVINEKNEKWYLRFKK
ncbi:MAG: hypothetical protein C0448_14465 [Sphingobacteriaceae bacterium]|nr:hypothetical protein [Sphingobacteriaceae bacterium]